MTKTKEWSEMGKTAKQNYHIAAKGLYGSTQISEIDYKAITKPKVKRKPRGRLESIIQQQIVSWIKSQGYMVTAITNSGKKSAITGHMDKMMGLLPGASDLFLIEPNSNYHGFWIELKSPGNKPTALQYEFMDKARQRGYKAEWYDTFESAKLAIEVYLLSR